MDLACQVENDAFLPWAHMELRVRCILSHIRMSNCCFGMEITECTSQRTGWYLTLPGGHQCLTIHAEQRSEAKLQDGVCMVRQASNHDTGQEYIVRPMGGGGGVAVQG